MGENSHRRFSLSFVVLVVVVEDDDGAPPSLTIAVRSRGDSEGGRGQGAGRAPGRGNDFVRVLSGALDWTADEICYLFLFRVYDELERRSGGKRFEHPR